jgi:hypothetical protein
VKNFGMNHAKPDAPDYRRPHDAEERYKNLPEVRDETAPQITANTSDCGRLVGKSTIYRTQRSYEQIPLAFTRSMATQLEGSK